MSAPGYPSPNQPQYPMPQSVGYPMPQPGGCPMPPYPMSHGGYGDSIMDKPPAPTPAGFNVGYQPFPDQPVMHKPDPESPGYKVVTVRQRVETLEVGGRTSQTFTFSDVRLQQKDNSQQALSAGSMRGPDAIGFPSPNQPQYPMPQPGGDTMPPYPMSHGGHGFPIMDQPPGPTPAGFKWAQ